MQTVCGLYLHRQNSQLNKLLTQFLFFMKVGEPGHKPSLFTKYKICYQLL